MNQKYILAKTSASNVVLARQEKGKNPFVLLVVRADGAIILSKKIKNRNLAFLLCVSDKIPCEKKIFFGNEQSALREAQKFVKKNKSKDRNN